MTQSQNPKLEPDQEDLENLLESQNHSTGLATEEYELSLLEVDGDEIEYAVKSGNMCFKGKISRNADEANYLEA